MKRLHAHEVLNMMGTKTYTEDRLKKEIVDTFGSDTRFYTCSADNLDAEQLVEFLKQKGKFKPQDEGFAFDETKRCNHH